MGNRINLGLILLVVVAIILFNAAYIVDAREKAVKLRFGQLVKADIEPGLHFKMPIFEDVRKFDGRIQTLDLLPQSYLTLEKKRLIVDSYATWRVKHVKKFYTATSGDLVIAANLLSSRLDNGLRDQFGTRTLHEVVSGQRDELMEELAAEMDVLTETEFGIELKDIRVKGIDLPPQVSESVFARMQAEREREARELRAKGKELAEGIRADADRQKTIIEAEAYREAEQTRGEGDAIAATTYAKAYTQDPDFYNFSRSMKAYRETFRGEQDVLVIDPSNDFLRFLKDPQGSN